MTRTGRHGSAHLTLAGAPARPPRCCSVCPYRPSRIIWLLRTIDELAQSGWSPAEAMASVLASGDPNPGFGPGMRRGLDDVADIGRALAAGKRNPIEISAYLCPYAAEDDAVPEQEAER